MRTHEGFRATLVACGAFYCMTVAQAAGPATYKVELPAQLLRTALPAIKDQTGLTFWLSSSTEPGEMHVPRLSGEFTADSLAEHLLAGSGWTYQFVPSLGYELCQRVCDSGTPVQAVPEVLIKGTASLNMDIAARVTTTSHMLLSTACRSGATTRAPRRK